MKPIKFDNTSEIPIPVDPFERIIGQDEVVRIAKMVPIQRRHLLLVGPPGTGKSLIAQAIASVLPKPTIEVSVLPNAERPERPIIEVRNQSHMKEEKDNSHIGHILMAYEVPPMVAERLGLRCKRCGSQSDARTLVCGACGADKFQPGIPPVFRDPQAMVSQGPVPRVTTTRVRSDGKQERVVYDLLGDGNVNMLTEADLKKLEEKMRRQQRKVIVPLNRSTFVQASAASETEMLGDIKHDPYNDHPQLGTPAYQRVIAGAVHEAHEGVLFIDELATLGPIQKFILTAMQDKHFPIVGRNPTSSGASIRVESAPCDFLLVGAINLNDIHTLIPPLRSRIRGDGYEVLMKSTMPDNLANRYKLCQFIAQEVKRDGKIAHFTFKAVEEIWNEASRIARTVDRTSNALSLRLRNLSGLIKLSGDLAVMEKEVFVEKKHVIDALVHARSIEEQIQENYDSWYSAASADYAQKKHMAGRETG